MNARSCTLKLGEPYGLPIGVASAACQSEIRPSVSPTASESPSGLNAAADAGVIVPSGSPVRADHNRTVTSWSPVDAITDPSGLKATSVTNPE